MLLNNNVSRGCYGLGTLALDDGAFHHFAVDASSHFLSALVARLLKTRLPREP